MAETLPSITQYYLPPTLSLAESVERWEHRTGQGGTYQANKFRLVYQPVLLAQAQTHYTNADIGLDQAVTHTFQVIDLLPDAVVQWEQWRTPPVDTSALDSAPRVTAEGHMNPPPAMTNPAQYARLQQDFIWHIHNISRATVPTMPGLGLVGHPGEPREVFRERAFKWAHKQRADEIRTAHRKFTALLKDMAAQHQDVLQYLKAEREDGMLQGESLYHAGEIGLHFIRGEILEAVFDILQLEASSQDHPVEDVQQAENEQLAARLKALQEEYEGAVAQINERWAERTAHIGQTTLAVPRERIYLEAFGLGWRPVYQGVMNGQAVALLALD
ncbi:MAG: hypothetical protein ACLFTK_13115 [Anaerolineales bacterium]